MIAPYKIKWAGLSSLDFDLWTELSFDSDNGPMSTFLNREAIETQRYDGSRTIHRFKYSDVLAPTITFVKQDYGEFDQETNRKILSWLTSSDQAGYLEIFHDDSNVISYKMFGSWTEIEQHKLGNGRVVGYTCTFTSNSPYAWSRQFIYPEVYADIEEVGSNKEDNDILEVVKKADFTIVCNTDEYNKPIYPKITITFTSEDEKTYFPIDVDPIQEKTYPMVPNVIYSWTEKYVKATQYVEGVEYYSNKSGTIAIPQPTSQDEITNGEYYVENTTPKLYVNLTGVDHNGKYMVKPTTSETEASSSTMDLKYYYFTDTNEIRTTVKTVKDEQTNYHWEFVTKIGMAVKLSNTYISNGVPTIKETIIAGGAMDEVVVIDGMNKLIFGTQDATTKIIGDHFNWEWLPLVYGENNITILGNCTVKFEWLEPRKVGSL